MHSWPASLGCFLSGVFIDIDHCVDFYYIRKEFPIGYKQLADFSYDLKETKVYLWFHAYEYLLVLWGLIFYFHLHKLCCNLRDSAYDMRSMDQSC